ncbi:MAG: peptidylprolyl isomerase [Myxococcota bacterium]
MTAPESKVGSAYGSPRALLWLAVGAVVGLLAAAVGLLRSGEVGAGLPGNAAASVNGEVIRLEELDRALAALDADRREPLGPEERQHVLDRLLDEELLVQRGIELGLVRHDRRVRGDIVAAVIELVVSQADDAEPTQAEVSAFYADNQAYFARTQRLWVRQVWVRGPALRSEAEASERAQQVVARLRAGESFEAVAEELGDPPVAPVPADLLPTTKLREYLGPTATRTAEALELGATSDPVRGASGYHVLQVVDRAPGFVPPLSEIGDDVRAELRRRSGDEALRRYLEDLRSRADVRIRAADS